MGGWVQNRRKRNYVVLVRSLTVGMNVLVGARVWNLLYTPDSLEYSRPPDLAKSGRGLCLRHLSLEIKKYCSELAAARIHLVVETEAEPGG